MSFWNLHVAKFIVLESWALANTQQQQQQQFAKKSIKTSTAQQQSQPQVFQLPRTWMKTGQTWRGIQQEEAIHVVNVTNGQRDVLTLKYAPRGSQECSIHNVGQTLLSPPPPSSSSSSADTNQNASSYCAYGSMPGYKVGDVVIAMNYGYISRGDIVNGRAPPMKICFPFELPLYCTDKENKNPQTTSSCSIHEKADLHSLWTASLQESLQESKAESN